MSNITPYGHITRLLKLHSGSIWDGNSLSSARPACLTASFEAENSQRSDFIHFQRRLFHLTIFRISVTDSKSISIFCDFYRFLCAKRPVSSSNHSLGDPSAPPTDSGPPLSIRLISSDSRMPDQPQSDQLGRHPERDFHHPGRPADHVQTDRRLRGEYRKPARAH